MGAACYVEDEAAWKCPKHPSKRRRNGVCPTCLRDRLVTLCPDCANARPCSCTTSASSSSSSSYGRVFNFSDGEPVFRRSRSLAVPFLRSKNNTTESTPDAGARTKTSSFLSVLKRSKTKRGEQGKEMKEDLSIVNGVNDKNFNCNNKIEDFANMITRSRSVSASGTAMTSGFRRGDVTSSAKGKLWPLPSPMKIFRSSKTPSSKVMVQQG